VDPDIRIDPEEFDAPWLTYQLDQAGVARRATITDLEFAGYVGTGQISRNARFRLTWSDPEGRPATVIAKLPSADAAARGWAFQTGLYANEHTFYQEIAHTVRVRTPHCWVADYDGGSQRCVLVMEDMARSAPGDQFRGCSPDQADLVLEQAVALHAPRWGDPAPMLSPPGPDPGDTVPRFYAAAIEPCLNRLGHGLSEDAVDLIEKFGAAMGRWSLGTDTPRTIVHGDFRPDNFLFATDLATDPAPYPATDPVSPPLTVVDWQTAANGCGPTDVAYFLGGAFAPERRRQIERDLLEEYRRQLNAAGVAYSRDDCWRDFRWGTLHGVVVAVLATMMAAQTERGDRLFTLMISRHAQHALDLEALGLVDQIRGA
jgi:hypothetical protein